MKCEQVKELLSAYLDGQLVADTYQRITYHLHHCRACSDTLADFRYLDTLLAQMPRVEPDTSLHVRIFASPIYRSTNIYPQPLQHPTQASPLPPFARAGRPHLVALPGGRPSPLAITMLEEERATDKIALSSIASSQRFLAPQYIPLPLRDKSLPHRIRPFFILAAITCAITLAFFAGVFIGIHL